MFKIERRKTNSGLKRGRPVWGWAANLVPLESSFQEQQFAKTIFLERSYRRESQKALEKFQFGTQNGPTRLRMGHKFSTIGKLFQIATAYKNNF